MWRCTTSLYKALDALLLAACKRILCCSSKTCRKAVWDDLGIEPLDLKRNKRNEHVVRFSRLLKKVRIVFGKKFLKKNGINVKFQVERESSGRSVFRYYKQY